jgi:hypothetical protein
MAVTQEFRENWLAMMQEMGYDETSVSDLLQQAEDGYYAMLVAGTIDNETQEFIPTGYARIPVGVLKMKFEDLTEAEKDELKLHYEDLTEEEKEELKQVSWDDIQDKPDIDLTHYLTDVTDEQFNAIFT